MRESFPRFTITSILFTLSLFTSFPTSAQEVPPQLQPPAGEQLFLQVHAKGNQVYVCKADAAKFAWTLTGPDAQLFEKDGKLFGKHFVGPSWEGSDGARVVGKVVANAPSPGNESIPWLLLSAVSHEGNGVLTRASMIQRINTKGGKAPASGCDASHVDEEKNVPYSADYLFYSSK